MYVEQANAETANRSGATPGWRVNQYIIIVGLESGEYALVNKADSMSLGLNLQRSYSGHNEDGDELAEGHFGRKQN